MNLITNLKTKEVTPCVGVWIETFKYFFAYTQILVTPCVGVWIETVKPGRLQDEFESHPAWVCGLKRTTAIVGVR